MKTDMTNTATMDTAPMLNGLDPVAVQGLIDTVAADPAQGMTHWAVTTHWNGGAQTRSRVTAYGIGGRTIQKDWTIETDEPIELGGTNTRPNPQEYLLASVNACMIVTYVTIASLMGIKLDGLTIATTGDIDLRGLFGLDDSVNPGYDQLHYTLTVRGDASDEQLEQIHMMMKKTSPNFANMARSIMVNSDLVIA